MLDWACEADAWIVEDDYDSETATAGARWRRCRDWTRRVRWSTSAASARCSSPPSAGFLVAPPALVAPLLRTRRFIDVHPPILEQMALADFLHEGHYARHLRRMRQQIQRRRDCLYRELRRHLGGLLEVSLPEAGLELVGWLPHDKDDQRAVALAEAAGIRVVALSRLSLEPLTRGGLLLGFAGVDEDEIQRGVRALAEALEAL